MLSPDPPVSDAETDIVTLPLVHPEGLADIEVVGGVGSTRFVGLVHEVVLPALSEIVTEHVDPFVVPVVHDPPETLMPLPPVSVEPESVNVVLPLECHVPLEGDHVPQLGAVVSKL